MIQETLQSMKKAQLNIDQSGFSVVEIIIASAVFALIVTAFIGSLLYFNKSAMAAGTRPRAVFLAEEGLEAARNISDEDFSNLVDGTYGLAVSGGQWIFSGGPDLTDNFSREVEVSTIDANTKEVSSMVSWDEGSMNSGSVSLVTRFTNWQVVVEVSESCSTVCQSLGYAGGICRQTQQRCAVKGEVYEVDGDQYCVEGPQADTCCCSL